MAISLSKLGVGIIKNNEKNDEIYINKISPPNNIKNISKESIGKASENTSCIYNHQRHAVGSIIENIDGSQSVCREDSSWERK